MPADDPAASPTRTTPPLPHIALGWYAVAMVAYVGIGYVWKPILMHWTLGPLFLVIVLHVVPTLAGRLRSRLRTESE